MEEPGGLQSMGSLRVGHDRATSISLFAFMTTEDILSCQIMLMGKKVKVKSLSRVRLFVTPWTVAYRAPPPMGFSGQRYWSGVPFPSPEDLPDPGMEPRSPSL